MKAVTMILSVIFLWFYSFNLLATEEKFQFDNADKRALFVELTHELRCPKCQNQNIADSDAMIAVDLRRKVHELLQKDYDRQQVIDFMKQRYGDFVYYQPPVNSMTIWLWLLPALFVVFALARIVITRKRQTSIIDDAQLAKAQALLERDE
jgi:cytochrome c-type biogenesis protein CcmH